MGEHFEDNIALRVQEAERARYPTSAQRSASPVVEQGDSVVVLAAQDGEDIYIPPEDLAAFRDFLQGRDADADSVRSITARELREGQGGYGCPACHGGFVPVMHSPLKIAQRIGEPRGQTAEIHIHQHCRSRLRVDLKEAYDHPDILLGDAL